RETNPSLREQVPPLVSIDERRAPALLLERGRVPEVAAGLVEAGRDRESAAPAALGVLPFTVLQKRYAQLVPALRVRRARQEGGRQLLRTLAGLAAGEGQLGDGRAQTVVLGVIVQGRAVAGERFPAIAESERLRSLAHEVPASLRILDLYGPYRHEGLP